ncbi:MAG TPA: cytochrome c peroxidase [Pyrinomonadaceae bacterium]
MRLARRKIVSLFLCGLTICSFRGYTVCNPSLPSAKPAPKTTSIKVPSGISESLWRLRTPPDNPLSPEKVELGRALFFDKRLSSDGTVSCGLCHDPAFAFTDANRLATGVRDRKGTRNTPTILNAMFSERFFWDGRAASLEEQVLHPISSPFEMGMESKQHLIDRVSSITEYRRQFKRVFKTEGITLETIAKAIAAYERTILSGNSAFDLFIAGNQSAISETQRRGWELFKGKARCIECHTYSQSTPFFTDFKFHNTGIAATDSLFAVLIENLPRSSLAKRPTIMAHSDGFSELGRYAITYQLNDIGAFKTPTLRDVELTSPFMHNGSLGTLLDVVNFYNRGGNANPYLDERMRPLGLADGEVNDLVEFMRSLTSKDVLKQCQTAKPQKRAARS